MSLEPLSDGVIDDLVKAALEEDRASEDISTIASIPLSLAGTTRIVAGQDGVAAGLPFVAATFRAIDRAVMFSGSLDDGDAFVVGAIVNEISGPARALMQGERVALNFLQRLSGIATVTRAYVNAVSGTGAVILDTRKTTPLLRDAEKYAVRCGGGQNHRRDLASMAMLKDNHLAALAGDEDSLRSTVKAIRNARPGIEIAIEVDSMDQLPKVLATGPEWILLDNMGEIGRASCRERV